MSKNKISRKQLGELRKNCIGVFFPTYFIYGPTPDEFYLDAIGDMPVKLNRTGVMFLIDALKNALKRIPK